MSSGGGGGTTTSTQVNYSPEEAAQRAKVMEEANRIYGATAPAISNAPYPGSLPVGFTPASQWGQASALDTSRAMEPGIENLMKSINFSLNDVLYPGSNPALQQYMQAAVRPITQSYMDPGGIMSQIRTQAGEANQVGSSRQGIAEGLAAGRYANAVGDTTAKVANEGYAQGLSAMGRAQALAPGAFQSMMLPAEIRSAVGSQQEAYNQNVQDYLAAARMWGLNAPWTPLQNYANIVFGGASPGTSATSEMNGGTNWGNKALGAVGGGLAGGYMALGTSIGGLPGMAAGALLGALLS